MNIRKIKDGLLDVNHLRKFIGNEIFFDAIKSSFKCQQIGDWPQARILVLAAHPDDESIGCGAAIKINSELKNEIKIVFLTDGSLGFPDLKRPTSREKNQMAKTREREAQNAAEVLGVNDLVFWRYRDGKLALNNTSVRLMDKILLDFKPTIIFTPYFLDKHQDHFETCRILSESLKKTKLETQIYSYEVWSPLFANRILNIDKYISVKEKAVKSYESQLKSRNYWEAILGLGSYRAKMFNAGNFAEAYFTATSKLYINLLDLISVKK